MDTIHLKIITPKKVVIEKDVISLNIPTYSGEITVLPNHTCLFSLLVEGVIKIKTKDSEDFLAIGGGYLETDGTDLNILVSKAHGQEEINKELILDAIENAKKILSQSKDRKERFEATSLLRRSLISIKLLKKKAPKSFTP